MRVEIFDVQRVYLFRSSAESRFFQLIFVARLIRLARHRQIEQKNITYPCSLPASKRAKMALWRGFFIVVGFGNYKQTSSKVGCTKTGANLGRRIVYIARLKITGLYGEIHSQLQHVMRDIRRIATEMDVSNFGQMFHDSNYRHACR